MGGRKGACVQKDPGMQQWEVCSLSVGDEHFVGKGIWLALRWPGCNGIDQDQTQALSGAGREMAVRRMVGRLIAR